MNDGERNERRKGVGKRGFGDTNAKSWDVWA